MYIENILLCISVLKIVRSLFFLFLSGNSIYKFSFRTKSRLFKKDSVRNFEGNMIWIKFYKCDANGVVFSREKERERESIANAPHYAYLSFFNAFAQRVKGMYARYVSMDYSNEVRTRRRHIRAHRTGNAVSLNRNLPSRANILNHPPRPEIGRIRENFNKVRAHVRKKILSVLSRISRDTGNFIL